MPELPEVEVAARQLRSWLSGRRVVRARAEKSRVIRGQGPQRFGQLAGHRLEELVRLGKWMVLRFDGDLGLLSHLGMTGKWIRRAQDEALPSHVRASFDLDDGSAVDYRDPRLFGRLWRGTPEELRALPALRALGPDPLLGVDPARLLAALGKTRRTLKEALMDQRTLAGLGNIYVSESLHRARLDPQQPGTATTAAQAGALAAAIEETLRTALALEDGPEPITYVEEGGENRFLVYDHAGEACTTCRTAIVRIVQGGRSSFYCPACQPPWRKRAPPRKPPRRGPAPKIRKR